MPMFTTLEDSEERLVKDGGQYDFMQDFESTLFQSFAQ